MKILDSGDKYYIAMVDTDLWFITSESQSRHSMIDLIEKDPFSTEEQKEIARYLREENEKTME